MEADWYVDPHGRYDGRYFDGTIWTSQVSSNGALAVDPDWPLADDESAAIQTATEAEVAVLEADVAVAPVVVGEATPDSEWPGSNGLTGLTESVEVPSEPIIASEPADHGQVVDSPLTESPEADGFAEGGPAVEPFAPPGPLRARFDVESPARTVAVLNDMPARVEDVQAAAVTPASDSTTNDAVVSPTARRSRWWLFLLAILVLTALALLAVSLFVNRDAADPADDTSQTDTGIVLDPADAIRVGDVEIVNGVTVLEDLAQWHRGSADARGVFLDDGASCWFGRLGDTAVPNAFCGPVGGTADTEFLFDKVALTFQGEESDVTAQAVTAATETDERIANTVELVGPVDAP